MLTLEKTDRGFRLVGVIDESADFSSLPDEAILLDMAQITRVNSSGILQWLRWKRGRSNQPILEQVPASFIKALSDVPELSRGARIHSILAPYIDPDTDEPEELLLGPEQLAAIRDSRVAPQLPSPTTARALVLDEDEENFFGFLFTGAELVTTLPGEVPGEVSAETSHSDADDRDDSETSAP